MNQRGGTHSIHIDAMLCDYAQVHAQRLFILGAGTGFAPSPSTNSPFLTHLWLALVISVPQTLLSIPHRLKVAITEQPNPPTGQPLTLPGIGFDADFVVGPPPRAQPGDETSVPIAIPLIGHYPHPGPWYTVIEIAGTELKRVRFHVQPGAQLPLLPGKAIHAEQP